MSRTMNKVVLSIFISLSLCGCAAAMPKKPLRDQVTTIVNDRNDLVTIQMAVGHNKKFCVKPLAYSALIARSPIEMVGYRGSYEESLEDKVTANNHEKWLKKMRAHAAEMASQVSGVIKSSSLDIRSIPIGISYKLELDKPRKKAKNGG